MTFNKTNIPDIILYTITAVVAAMCVIIYITPPSMFPDPSWGFQVMRCMQNGGGFNLLIGPDPKNIAKHISPFLSWWSPGQYLVPYLFKILLPVNTGHASALTITLGNACGLLGFYRFFKQLGFSKPVAALSLAFIFIQQAFWIPYGFYNGGEVLLFGFEGWFLYGCVSFEKTDWKLVLFVLLSGWLGFICKSSFLWIYASGLLCLWIFLSNEQTTIWAWIKKGLWLGIPAVVSIATIYVFYLAKGENPSSASAGFKLTWETFSFPLAAPMLAGFSVDDILNGLVYSPDGPHFSPVATIIILLGLALLSLIIILAIFRLVPNKTYKLILVVFYCAATLFFGYSFLKQATISYEARHFRLIGLLIVPGVIYIVSKVNFYWQTMFLLICAGIAYNSYNFVRATHKGNGLGAHGNSGLSQQFIDQASLNYIMSLDEQHIPALFVFISADIGLEIMHHRIITLDPYDSEIAEEDRVPYLGHGETIYMVLPTSYDSKKTAFMFKYFPGFTKFTPKALSKNYTLYIGQ